MPTKKVIKKKEEKTAIAVAPSKYFAGIGRRKRSIARVRFSVESKKEGVFMVNEKDLKKYFPISELSGIAMSPLDAAGDPKDFSVTVMVSGGGVRGQAEAVRLGLARAIVVFNADLKKSLRDLGYLTRDDRVVERKKAGLKKARRAPQWQKR